tara:strand:+ start:6467 stop:6700 length:234 start_codon:yes stop_codon:yes gene_type:complete
MNEEYGDLTVLLKMLVDKVQELERYVYDQDNILMKSGLVKVGGARPNRATSSMPDANGISKMDWSQLDEMVKGMTGE